MTKKLMWAAGLFFGWLLLVNLLGQGPGGTLQWLGDFTGGLFGLTVIALLYLVPLTVAVRRQHRNRLAIGVLNVALGWTFIGWLGALIWACTANTERV